LGFLATLNLITVEYLDKRNAPPVTVLNNTVPKKSKVGKADEAIIRNQEKK